MLKGSILQCFRPSLSYHLSLRSLFCLFLSGHFTQVLLYHLNCKKIINAFDNHETITPPPSPRNHKTEVSLSLLVWIPPPGILQSYPSQHSVSGHHRLASKTPYKNWSRFAGVLMVVHFCFLRTCFLMNTGPKVIKLFSCSTQLSTKVILLINVKMPTIH